MTLAAKTALVTGAGRGVGEGIAGALAERGVTVLINDIHAEQAQRVASEIREAGGQAHALPYDAGDPEEVLAGIRAAQDLAGPIDVFVSNAGIPENRRTVPFRDSEPARDWVPYISLNVYGMLYGVHAVLGPMCERGWGRLILISSGSGARGLPAGQAVYGGSKAFADGMLRHLALEVARDGVTVNAVAPGLMRSAMFHQTDEQINAGVASIPVGRIGEARDIGETVAWLASDATSWITGQVIHVNGGAYQGR